LTTRLCLQFVQAHSKISARKALAQTHLVRVNQELHSQFKSASPELTDGLTVFVAGSIGRGDCGKSSDLDLFALSEKPKSRLEQYQVFSRLIAANENCGFGKFSNDGEYLSVFPVETHLATIGTPRDDAENWFTVRMLFLLESRCVGNETAYRAALETILKVYFRDDTPPHKPFLPVFLINDILRYWRTICLNYEQTRHDDKRDWRKKRFNLKFSRMLTIFGAVAPLVAQCTDGREEFIALCQTYTPIERLAVAMDKLGLVPNQPFADFLDAYEFFLTEKERPNFETEVEQNKTLKKQLDGKADMFASFINSIITSEKIDPFLRRVIVL
jgi:predicted nucleotidyltransferase